MGVRNEGARARRRQKLKEQSSLMSVPGSEMDYKVTSPTPTLKNHFFWAVLEQIQVGDMTFPHLSQYNKPDISGRDLNSVTHVLCVKGERVKGDFDTKATQTTFSNAPPNETWLPVAIRTEHDVIERKVTKVPSEQSVKDEYTEKPHEKAKPKEVIIKRTRRKSWKLISDFYHKKRDRSRSMNTAKQEYNLKSGGSDIENNFVINIQEEEFSKEMVENEKNRSNSHTIERRPDVRDNTPDRWKLRAGAESASKTFDFKSSITRDKTLKRDSVRNWTIGPSEHLLKTPSGSNRYLYVSKTSKSLVK